MWSYTTLQVTQEARAEKDNKINRDNVDAKSRNGDAEDDDDEDHEGGDKVGTHWCDTSRVFISSQLEWIYDSSHFSWLIYYYRVRRLPRYLRPVGDCFGKLQPAANCIASAMRKMKTFCRRQISHQM